MPFNLKQKQARLSIEAKVKAIESRLEEIFSEYKELEGTEEANLDKLRLNTNPDSTIGASLSSKHTGVNSDLTEKRLDNEKSMFSEHRKNISGNVPKLEEKRLSGKPVEKEKYKSANS